LYPTAGNVGQDQYGVAEGPPVNKCIGEFDDRSRSSHRTAISREHGGFDLPIILSITRHEGVRSWLVANAAQDESIEEHPAGVQDAGATENLPEYREYPFGAAHS
jgi:hypothetical protein